MAYSLLKSTMLLHALLLVCLQSGMGVFAFDPAELDPEFWNEQAMKTLKEALNNRRIENPAKNVILFVGDGMSITTVTAARILKGQMKGMTGEEETLAYETFPNIGLSKTYTVDRQTPDSAGTATAYHTGVKTNLATIGVTARAIWTNCASSQVKGVKTKSIMAHAQESGKSTGFITTARITHASPAPLYAHTPDRRWERDTLLTEEAQRNGCLDIGVQIVGDVGREAKVVMGGGRRELTPPDVLDPESGNGGRRGDGRDLIKEWADYKRSNSQTVANVWNKDQLDRVDPTTTDNLIGIFSESHMCYSPYSATPECDDPTVADMTEKAIRVLRKNPMGYFLFVEGAGIDLAHHFGLASEAIHDAVALENAVQRAVDLVDLEDTLIIVTSDHSVPVVMVGYSTRGNNILGLIDQNGYGIPFDHPRHISNLDNKTFPVLVYGTGVGHICPRPEYTQRKRYVRTQ